MPKRARKPSVDEEAGFKDHRLGRLNLKSRRARRYAVLLVAVYAIGAFAFYMLQDVIILAHFKLRNWAFDEGWLPCQLRKQPLVFVHGADEAVIVWETNCPYQSMGLSLQDTAVGEEEELSDDVRELRLRDSPRLTLDIFVERLDMLDATNTHFVYRAILRDLEPARAYTYRVYRSTASSKRVILSEHTFIWLASSHSPLSPPSPTSLPRVLNIAAFADNQFGLKVFHRIVKQISRLDRFVPPHLRVDADSAISSSQQPLPDLVLHAGDAVQSVSNLQQWQTDFHDPLFHHSSIGSRVPILYSRGNHDYDPKGAYLYTGGSGAGSSATTWQSLSIGRTRWVVLDSNVDRGAGDEQERWLRDELSGPAWAEATLRIVVVHVPPFLEYWEPDPWNSGQNMW
jgi:hypothetical protein